MKKDCKKRAKYIPLFIVLFIIAVFAFSYFVMSLWNWLIPDLFGGPLISMWQAIGLLLLSKILFGSFNHGHSKNNKCDNHSHHHDEWKEHIHEKFKENSTTNEDIDSSKTV